MTNDEDTNLVTRERLNKNSESSRDKVQRIREQPARMSQAD